MQRARERIYFYHFHQPKQNQFCRRFEQCLVVEKIVMTRLLDIIQNNHVKFTRKSVLSSIVGIILVLTLCLVNQQQPTTISNYLERDEIASTAAIDYSTSFQAPKMWVSMALCWGNRINLYHKSQFPYALAGQLSTKLWLQVVNVSVIFHIVVCNESQVYDNYTLNEYVQALEESGVVVKILNIQNDCDKCVLEAQLVRLLAYLSSREVKDPDIVIMADVDTFPMKQSILEPIERNPDKSVWVFQYDDSAKHNSTFSMSFTAMRSQTWKQLLQNSQSTTELIEKFDEKLQLKKRELTWDYDQLIMTRAILESRLCSFPSNSSLWLDLRMEPIEMEVNLDWHTCFHGENLGDCHRNEVNNFCRYWHFIPTERREELVEKYKEIMGEKAPDTDFVHKFKNVKFEMEKILGLRL